MGILHSFDRIRLQGLLWYLSKAKVLLKDFKEFATGLAAEVCADAAELVPLRTQSSPFRPLIQPFHPSSISGPRKIKYKRPIPKAMKPLPYSAFAHRPFAVLASFALLLAVASLQTALADAIYTVRQSFSVKDLPDGAKRVRGWFWMPEDRPEQRVIDFRVVEAPESFRITRDPC